MVQHDGPSIDKVPPYPRFYNYDPKQNRRSIIHRNPYAHEPGTTAVADKLGSTFSAGRLPTDDVG